MPIQQISEIVIWYGLKLLIIMHKFTMMNVETMTGAASVFY